MNDKKLTRLQATVLLRALQVALDPKGSPPLQGHERKITEEELSEFAVQLFQEAED